MSLFSSVKCGKVRKPNSAKCSGKIISSNIMDLLNLKQFLKLPLKRHLLCLLGNLCLLNFTEHRKKKQNKTLFYPGMTGF